MKNRRGWLLVFPGLQTSNGGRLVGIRARAVMYEPSLQHCHEQTSSPEPVRCLTCYTETRGSESRAAAGQG